MTAQARRRVWIGMALLTGAALRAMFVLRHPAFGGDSTIYGELAHNMLAHHLFGLKDDTLHPILFRMPGYPAFLAVCFVLFGDGNLLAAVWVQVMLDLATCGVMAWLAWRMAGERAARWTLWLGALCPFTANYAAMALAETCSLLCVAVAFAALERWVEAWRAGGRGLRWAVLLGATLAWAVFLRPDEGLLAAAVVPAMLWCCWRGGDARWTRGMAPVAVVCCCVLLPIAGWAARNWRVFHVVQPLAPRYANDPGEDVPLGFQRWYRTWAIGYPATVNVYWNYDANAIDFADLPARAFDSAEQRAQTAALIAQYDDVQSATPAFDAAFARIAAERVRAHPLRYYIELPVARELDMWFRPRIEWMALPLDWWRLREHPRATIAASAYALLNAAYLALALAGFVMMRRRWRREGVLLGAMMAFVVLRCALLLTLDNSEPRYTLECFPLVVLFAGIACARRRESGADEAG